MALWHVSFLLLPKSAVAEFDEVPEKTFLAYVDEDGGIPQQFTLPADYAARLSALLPRKESWAPELEIWGHEHSDDVQIWRQAGRVSSIGVRVDVRKLDDALLGRFLALADDWSCVLVERRYRKVCRMNVLELRALIAGHPHRRAMSDPAAWLPVLADEVRKKDREV